MARKIFFAERASLLRGQVNHWRDARGRCMARADDAATRESPPLTLTTTNTMPAAPYIPAKDADFESWLLNFSTLLTAAPTDFGLTAPAAVIVAGVYTTWHASYLLATDPATRTAPTVAQKDADRAAAEFTVRPYAQQIAKNASVTPENKAAIGVNPPNTSPVPIPPPTTFPQVSLRSGEPLAHILQYQDSGAGTGKAKPYGAIGCQVFRSVGTVAATDPAQASFYAQPTKSPFRSEFEAADRGKVCTYFARWITQGGPGGVAQTGPWSDPVTAIIM